MDEIVVSVVCYNNEEEVLQFAKQLEQQSFRDHICLLITCNAIVDMFSFRVEISKIGIKTTIYEPNVNLGYLGGNLFAINDYAENHAFTWVMISNTDILFTSSSFLKDFVESGLSDTICCVGPNVVSQIDERQHNPYMEKRPTKSRMIVRYLAFSSVISCELYAGLAKIKAKYGPKKANFHHSAYVYAVHGCCFFVRRDLLAPLSDNSEGVFMYGEEILVAETARNVHKKVYYYASLGVVHNENQVTRRVNAKKTQEWKKASTLYLVNKYFA